MTQNTDKDRGFVNGAVGKVVKVLRRDVLVVETTAGVRLLIHPVWKLRKPYMPVSYAYATTIRRAQGATLDQVALFFDRKSPDPGYAYVGVSRVRRRQDAFLIGRVRRSDWRPVGGDPRGNEQVFPSSASETYED